MHQFVVDRRETLVEVTGLGTLCDKSVDNEPHRMKTPAAATAFEGPSVADLSLNRGSANGEVVQEE